MKKVIALLAFLALSAFGAEYTATNAGGTSTFIATDDQCISQEVVKHLQDPEEAKLFRAGRGIINGKTFDACWILDVDHLDVLYEDGDTGVVPLIDFIQSKGEGV